MFGNFYKNKNVLVTGHTGFKGGWLSFWLHELGANVNGYSLDPYSGEGFFSKTGLSSKIGDYRGDIRDKERVKDIFKDCKPEVVFHLAAMPIVNECYDFPLDAFETNAIGTANILETVRSCESVKAIVLITTDKVYNNIEQIWGYRENDSLGGKDPYSASKACSEMVINAYRNSYFKKGGIFSIGCASARAGNVIGGGDWQRDRLVPDCIKALNQGVQIKLRNPMATRPWQHVLDASSGYLLLGKNLFENPDKFSSAWNFGPNIDSVLTVQELVDHLVKGWGTGETIVEKQENARYEAKLLSLDNTKAKMELKWNPIFTIKEAIHETIEWYKNTRHANETEAYKISKDQLLHYKELAEERNNKWARE